MSEMLPEIGIICLFAMIIGVYRGFQDRFGQNVRKGIADYITARDADFQDTYDKSPLLDQQ